MLCKPRENSNTLQHKIQSNLCPQQLPNHINIRNIEGLGHRALRGWGRKQCCLLAKEAINSIQHLQAGKFRSEPAWLWTGFFGNLVFRREKNCHSNIPIFRHVSCRSCSQGSAASSHTCALWTFVFLTVLKRELCLMIDILDCVSLWFLKKYMEILPFPHASPLNCFLFSIPLKWWEQLLPQICRYMFLTVVLRYANV